MAEQHSNFSFMIFGALLPHGLRLVRYMANPAQALRFRELLLLYDCYLTTMTIAYQPTTINCLPWQIHVWLSPSDYLILPKIPVDICLGLHFNSMSSSESSCLLPGSEYSLWGFFLTASFLAREHLKLFW